MQQVIANNIFLTLYLEDYTFSLQCYFWHNSHKLDCIFLSFIYYIFIQLTFLRNFKIRY